MFVVDVGGTFLKLAEVPKGSVELQRVTKVEMPPAKLLANGGYAYDRDALREFVCVTISQYIADARDQSGSHIAITGQMHGLSVTSGDSSGLQRNVFTWRQASGGDKNLHRHLLTQIPDPLFIALGRDVKMGSPLLRLMEERESLNSGSRICSLIGFVAECLSNESMQQIHVTDAASFGLVDVNTMDWSADAVSLAGLQLDVLPEIVRSVTRIGEFMGHQVLTPVGDQQASIFGAELNANEISFNLATGGQVSTLRKIESSIGQCRPYIDGSIFSTITHLPAGRAINGILRLLGDASSLSLSDLWNQVDQRAEEIVVAAETQIMQIDPLFFSTSFGDFGTAIRLVEPELTFDHVVAAVLKGAVSRWVEAFDELVLAGQSEAVISGGLVSGDGPLRRIFEQAFVGRISHTREVTDEDAALVGVARCAVAEEYF